MAPKEPETDVAPQSGEEEAPDAAAGVKRPASSDGDDSSAAKKVAADEKQTFQGGCHCGNIRYTVDINPKDITATRCNCTFCQKFGVTSLSVEKPEADFKLLKPKERGDMADYAPRTKSVHRYYCRDCGVHVFGDGYYEYEGQRYDFFSLSLNTVDQPQEGIDLSEVKIKYWDGLHDNWFAGQGEKPFAGGLA